MGKYIDHRLVARPESDNTFWTDTKPRANLVRLQKVEDAVTHWQKANK